MEVGGLQDPKSQYITQEACAAGQEVTVLQEVVEVLQGVTGGRRSPGDLSGERAEAEAGEPTPGDEPGAISNISWLASSWPISATSVSVQASTRHGWVDGRAGQQAERNDTDT